MGEITQSDHVIKAVDVHQGMNMNQYLFVLRSSKTHSKRDRPQKVTIRAADRQDLPKKVHTFFCPAKIIAEYIQLRPEIEVNEEQFLIFENGLPLKSSQFRNVLRELLAKLDLDPDIYDTHSFRIGRATDLLKFGMSVENIKKIGRWKSNTVFDYLRE